MKDKCRGLQNHIFGGLSLERSQPSGETNGFKIAKCQVREQTARFRNLERGALDPAWLVRIQGAAGVLKIHH